MPNVRVIIDGQEVKVPAGSTVLEAAEAAGIEIPTLCHHPALKPIGACRVCLVEVEKQRVLQPACTFPVSDGMVIHTRSPKAEDSRRFVLQLLFSERNHFCMFCQMSGSCELQSLGYQYGLDHWEFDRPFPKYDVDASRKYFVMDHNRCILCRRCIRICDELVGNNTLGLKNRGAQTMVVADLDVPFGESSCVSCGSCLQVCPTGALMDRASAYMGAKSEVTRTKSTCMACSVGCGVELIVRQNRVIRVDGDWDAEPNKGLLCELGRFRLMYDNRHRVRQPMVKGENGWQTVELDEALQTVADKIRPNKDDLLTLASGYVTNEVAQSLVNELPGTKKLLQGGLPGLDSNAISVLDEADAYVVVGVDLTKDYQVVGFAVKRNVRHREAKLALVDDQAENGLAPWASAKWGLDQLGEAIAFCSQAESPAIIYDSTEAAAAERLIKAVPKAQVIALTPGGNARGLAAAGIRDAFTGQEQASVYYVLAGELEQVDPSWLEALKAASFVVVQSCFHEPWEQVADVILPAPTVWEKSGTMVNAEGKTCQISQAVTTRLAAEGDIIARLAALLS